VGRGQHTSRGLASYRAVAAIRSRSAAPCKTDRPEARRAITASSSRRHRRLLLEDDAALAGRLFARDVPAAIEDHVSVLGNASAIEAALAWYRAKQGLAATSAPSRCRRSISGATPTPPSGRRRARHPEFIGAAYAMEVPAGRRHFVMDRPPAKPTELMLAHMKKAPGVGGRARVAALLESRYHAPPHEREFYAWLARNRADRRRQIWRHPRAARRPEELGDIVLFDIPQAEGVAKGRRSTSPASPVEGFDAAYSGSSSYKDIEGSDVVDRDRGRARASPACRPNDLVGITPR